MADDKPDEILTLVSKSEELLDMFRKGRQFTEELMAENERLRYRIVQLEKEKMDLYSTLMREVERLRLDNSQMSQKLDFFDRRFQEIEAENKDFAQRYVEVEEQNDNLANLYVASYQLHSTLDPTEVVQCIKEILMNLIGSEEFGLFVVDEETSELVLAGCEGEIATRLDRGRVSFGEGLEGIVALKGEAFFTDDAGESGEVCACIPLKIKERVVGVIATSSQRSFERARSSIDRATGRTRCDRAGQLETIRDRRPKA
jgi:hypothetical protein